MSLLWSCPLQMNAWALTLWPEGPVDVAQLWCLCDSGDILSDGEKWQCISIENTLDSKTGVQLQHRPPRACPTVGIKHKCGTLWEILGHLRECFKPPSTLPFPPPPLFLLPSLSLSSCPHPNLNPPLPQHLVALFWWEEYHCVKRGSEIVLEHNGCSSQAVHWCCDALCLSLYVFVEVLPPYSDQ